MTDEAITGAGRRPVTNRRVRARMGSPVHSSADSPELDFQLRVVRCPAALSLALALIRPALEAAVRDHLPTARPRLAMSPRRRTTAAQ